MCRFPYHYLYIVGRQAIVATQLAITGAPYASAIRRIDHARNVSARKLCILWVDGDEVKRLRKLRSARSRGILGYSPELTTPKPRSLALRAVRSTAPDTARQAISAVMG